MSCYVIVNELCIISEDQFHASGAIEMPMKTGEVLVFTLCFSAFACVYKQSFCLSWPHKFQGN